MNARSTSIAAAVLVAASMLTAGCGSSDRGAKVSSATNLTPPPALAKRGTLVFCSDIGYPPLEFAGTNGAPAGADIEIGTELAQRMQLK
ncbi:MAG: ABC transporter substrate-binding protein, partial [Thermoleophilia bacterium]|nr:ABC transporter substrate-binding protein [Thermoleophilia bacterium]